MCAGFRERPYQFEVQRSSGELLAPCSTRARLAQSVEHETLNLRVVGSSPTLGVGFAANLDFYLPRVGLLPAVYSRFKTALLEAQGADTRNFLLSTDAFKLCC